MMHRRGGCAAPCGATILHSSEATGVTRAPLRAKEETAVPPGTTSRFLSDAIREFDLRLEFQRISRLVITPEPNAVRIDFVTALPTAPIVEIFSLQRDSSGGLVFAGVPLLRVAFDFLTGTVSTEHHARMAGLPQQHDCMYRITAAGGAGKPAVVTGPVRTGRRDVSVLVRDILVFNDGDPGLGGSGQLTFDFGLYDESDDRVAQREYRTSISSGELRELPFGTSPAMTRQFADDWASMYVLGVEEDADIFQFLEDYPAPPRLPGTTTAYENDDEVFADAMQTLRLPDTTGEHRVGWSLDSGPHGIHYIVTGWLTVMVDCPPAIRFRALGKVKTGSATMSTRSASASVVAPGGGSRQFALTPTGALAINTETRRWRTPRWSVLVDDGADAATVVALDEESAVVLSVAGSRLRQRRVRLDGDSGGEPVVITDDVGTQLTRADSPGGVVAVVVLGADGAARALLVDPAGREQRAVDLGGSFARPPSIVWLDDETLVLTGTEGSGGILSATVRAETLRDAERAEVEWVPLSGEEVVAVASVVDDEGGAQLVGLTADRRLLARGRGDDGWSSRWREVGALDVSTPIENAEPEGRRPSG
jgi:hypothetical protein